MNKYYSVTLAHAVSDENGKGTNGKAGDQTGKEVRFQPWYLRSKGWHTILRASKTVRDKMVKNAIAAVRNPNYGYDMNNRYTAFDYLKTRGYDFEKLDIPAEGDCSQMVTTNANYAGVPIPRDTSTSTMKKRYLDSGKFSLLTDPIYTKQPDYLYAGDILLGEGHTATVVNLIWWLESTLKPGAKNREADIQALQARLNEVGKYGLEIDGSFGPATKEAVIKFQTKKKLKADGIVNKETAEALGMLFGN